MLVTLKTILSKAHRRGYAVGAFNINNLEICQAVMIAAEKMRSPVVLQTSEGAIDYAGMDYLAAIARLAAEKARVPVVFHLDHGKDPKLVERAIKSGFYTSVMIDGSSHPYKENVRITKKIVAMAHRDDFFRNPNVFFVRMGRAVDHHRSVKSAFDCALHQFRILSVIQMKNDRHARLLCGQPSDGREVIHARVINRTLGGLKHHRRTHFFRRDHDRLADFQIVDVKGADGITAAMGFTKNCFECDQHPSLSLRGPRA